MGGIVTLIVYFLLGTVLVVGIGIAVQLDQNKQRRRREEEKDGKVRNDLNSEEENLRDLLNQLKVFI